MLRPTSRSTSAITTALLALALGAATLAPACGKKSDGPAPAKDDAAAPAVPPITMPALGVDQVSKLNFVYDAGRASYDKGVAALRAKDWAAVRAGAEGALAKDPRHLDASYLLAQALAQLGEHAAAVDHLVTALAADYYKYAPGLGADPHLAPLLATAHGQAVTELATRIGAAYAERVRGGVWVVARRSPFKLPATGAYASARGELYAYDVATRRYLRLTHTNHAVAGFVRAASGTEVAVLGFEQVVRPAPARGAAPGADAPPTFKEAWVWRHDATTWQPIGKKTKLPAAREVVVGYGAGDRLLVATHPATGRWTVGAPAVAAVDATTGKLAAVAPELPAPRIALTLDDGRVVRAPGGVTAAWTGEPPTAPALTAGGPAIAVPESGRAAQASLALSPDGALLAFATATDPCAEGTAPSLYVATTKTGALKHVLTATSRFGTRWISPTLLAYEDGAAGVRLWDAGTGRELVRLDNPAGIALDVLSGAPGPRCTGAPAPAEPPADGEPADAAGDGAPPLPPEDELPPEHSVEPADGSGPVTRPE